MVEVPYVGEKIEIVPASDAKKIYVAPSGLELERLQEQAAERVVKALEVLEERKARLTGPRVRKMIYVRPKEPFQRVIVGFDGVIMKEGALVDPNNIYIARRLRDGSLEIVDTTAVAQPEQPTAPPTEETPQSEAVHPAE